MAAIDLLFQGEKVAATLDSSAADHASVTLADGRHEFRLVEIHTGRWLLENSQGQMRCHVARFKDRIWVWVNGRSFEFTIPAQDANEHSAGHGGINDARAPMPGTLIKLAVKEGDAVAEGQVMAILEAMKMEHQIRAPRSGTVEKIHGTVGQIIDAGALVVSLIEATENV